MTREELAALQMTAETDAHDEQVARLAATQAADQLATAQGAKNAADTMVTQKAGVASSAIADYFAGAQLYFESLRMPPAPTPVPVPTPIPG